MTTTRPLTSIDTAIIHCTATKPDQDIGAETIRRWHVQERKWADIGYHYVIRRDGTVEEGRPIDQIGAHAQGHNTHSIGIALVGGLDAAGRPDANFTLRQYNALQTLLADLNSVRGIPLRLMGHRDVSQKHCPCFDVHELFR